MRLHALVHEADQILRHRALIQGREAGLLELVGKLLQLRQAVELAALAQGARPGEDGRHRVRGGLLAAQMAVIVLCHGAVSGLILRRAVRRDKHGRHHGKAAEGRGDHVAHDVAVIVLAGPDEAALAADDAGNGVVDEGVEVGNAELLELRAVVLELLLKDLLELAVIDLGDGVLRGEPQILLRINGILEAGARKRADALFLVVGGLPDGGAVDLLHEKLLLLAALADERQRGGAGLGRVEVDRLIHVAIGMTGDGDGLFPVLYDGMDGVDADGRAEHGAVQNGADRAVRALPHFGELRILHHALLVRRDGGAFDGHAEAAGGVGGLDRHLILRLVAVQQAEVIILGLQLHKGQDEFVLDHLPKDTGHLVAVHLHQRGRHFDLFHAVAPPVSYECYGFSPRCARRNNSSGSRPE